MSWPGRANELPVAELRRLEVPPSTLGTLVRKGVVRIEERPADFHLTHLNAFAQPEHELNPAQCERSPRSPPRLKPASFARFFCTASLDREKPRCISPPCAVRLMPAAASILLVPEIGLTPAMAAQLHQAFGSEVALLHSALTPKSAPSSGIASAKGKHASWSARARPFLRRSRI